METEVNSRNSEFSFISILKTEADSKDMRKGDRTEARIKWSTCALLEFTRLSDLTVRDVCAEAKIAQGTFYLYFPDKQNLLNKILLEFIAFLRAQMISRSGGAGDHRDSVQRTIMAYYHLVENNSGLMKCLISHYEDFPEISPIAAEMNNTWTTIVVRSAQEWLRANNRDDEVDEQELFRRCYALGGMVDQYMSYLFLSKDDKVMAYSNNPEDVIETLTHIWISALPN